MATETAVREALETASVKYADGLAIVSKLLQYIHEWPIKGPDDARALADRFFGLLSEPDRRILGVHGDQVSEKFESFRRKLQSAETNKVVRIVSRCNSAIVGEPPAAFRPPAARFDRAPN